MKIVLLQINDPIVDIMHEPQFVIPRWPLGFTDEEVDALVLQHDFDTLFNFNGAYYCAENNPSDTHESQDTGW